MSRERRKESKKKARKHRVDIRGTIPLFFRRYYFVILVGRDTREETQQIEAERRHKAKRINNAITAIFLLIPFLIVLFLLLYYLKSALGINIMPVLHFSDLTNWLYNTLDRIFKLE
ncbi:MAG: hypothetical protein PQJ59_07445 [Spirochaetales bacterium]|nr:hypothetical protein [Spirochaetales bacterium]